MEQHKQEAVGFAAMNNDGILNPFNFTLRMMKDDDITLKVLYCGICHTDLATIRNMWGNAKYPVVPGHEIVGVVTEIGQNVQKFKIGDRVGVGYLVGSCRTCDSCEQDLENYCPNFICSFNSFFPDGEKTYGGFSDVLVVNEHFAARIPDNLNLEKVAPLMCAGLTVYYPIKFYELNKPGKHIGVVGLGGLGHMAIKFGKAFGIKVTVISTSPEKKNEAIELLGAYSFIDSNNLEQMKAAMATMDGIIDTVPFVHSFEPLFGLLKTHGKLIMLGGSAKPIELYAFPLISGGKSLQGSMIGGMKDMQEMLDFAGKHNVAAEVEIVGMNKVNDAMNRLAKGDVRYRFVIDVASTISDACRVQVV